MTPGRIERLSAWRASRALAVAIHVATRDAAFDRDPGLRADLRGAATTIMTSLAEGCDQTAPADFDRGLRVAATACLELASLLYLAEDTELLPARTASAARESAASVCRLIHALRLGVLAHWAGIDAASGASLVH